MPKGGVMKELYQLNVKSFDMPGLKGTWYYESEKDRLGVIQHHLERSEFSQFDDKHLGRMVDIIDMSKELDGSSDYCITCTLTSKRSRSKISCILLTIEKLNVVSA